jgi:hypothetical protein
MSRGECVYPNLYIILCGMAAAGKGVALGPAARLLQTLPDHHLAPSSTTAAALADELEDAVVHIVDFANGNTQYNGLTVMSNELGVFIPTYDNVMLSMLTDVYDGKGYSERRRGRGKRLEIPGAHLSIIGGTTPSYIGTTLPEAAWEQGFTSRTIMIYDDPQDAVAIEEELGGTNDDLFKALELDLQELTAEVGRVRWDKEALDHFNKWYTGGGNPRPTHPRLNTYNGRRHYNLMKMCLIFAVSRGAKTIAKIDVELALDLLLETEHEMPNIFKAMRTSTDSGILDEAWHFIQSAWSKKQAPIPEALFTQFMMGRAPGYAVAGLIDNMVTAKLVKRVDVAKVGVCYVPGDKREV